MPQDVPAAARPRIDAFIDLRSPYSYVALAPARTMAREIGFVLNWRPYMIDIEAGYGPAGLRDPRALRKVRYIYKDARRLAAPQGLTIRGPERIFDATQAHIGMLYAKRARLLDAYLDAVYEKFFARAIDIEDRADLARLVVDIGGSPADFQTYLGGDGHADLAGHAEEAEENGIFGVPTFLYEGELYWGSDRLPLLRTAIVDVRAAAGSLA